LCLYSVFGNNGFYGFIRGFASVLNCYNSMIVPTFTEEIMSNLESARVALEKELDDARRGAAYWATRVEALEVTLADLDRCFSRNGDELLIGRRQVGLEASSEVGAEAKRKYARKRVQLPASEQNELPSTKRGFWMSLVTDTPRTAAELLGEVLRSLPFEATPKQKQQLQSRMTGALNSLVERKLITDEGSGRKRRFFRA